MSTFAQTVLGLVAAACTTFAFLPQVIKTWRTRSTTLFLTSTILYFKLRHGRFYCIKSL